MIGRSLVVVELEEDDENELGRRICCGVIVQRTCLNTTIEYNNYVRRECADKFAMFPETGTCDIR